jgi:hypothetical protein
MTKGLLVVIKISFEKLADGLERSEEHPVDRFPGATNCPVRPS